MGGEGHQGQKRKYIIMRLLIKASVSFIKNMQSSCGNKTGSMKLRPNHLNEKKKKQQQQTDFVRLTLLL